MPEIFAVEAERPGDSEDKELSNKLGASIKKASGKKDSGGYGCPKKRCDHRSCRSRVKEISSVERVIQRQRDKSTKLGQHLVGRECECRSIPEQLTQ